jgi:Arc/MetJ-type ribon-helix-helix transcriptional regulator
MVRTQIYLSEKQRAHLTQLATHKGENVSELIRRAVEYYLSSQEREEQAAGEAHERIFHKAFGMWKDNEADFASIRKSADRI